ncbi:aspartate/glutamate racemase family protein [Salinicoccus albus]|uniref:aspartate/glutamate racemase family protein n=1 Tax=Salinicoccus albus TaxID=418756 RepID=UPI000360C5CC|nr:aspartate/glutamate racemase family protein [Salinicoccus albus]
MDNLSVGIIRVFTTEDQEITNSHGNKIEETYNIRCINKCIHQQPKGIYDEESETKAIPKIIELAKEFENHHKVSCIAISCAADPGLELVRNEVSVPVVGAGSSAAHMAKTVSQKIGILTIANEVPQAMTRILGDSLISWRKPSAVNNTADLLKGYAIENSLATAKELMRDGAEVIVFACTGYVTIGFGDILKNKLGVTVIDPVETEGNALSFILRGE